jgi:hypothetical protein
VEEQFYLVWPLLFGAACLAARRNTAWLRRLHSHAHRALALCVVLTRRGSPWAFFSLPTRAGEFAAAGLLAAWVVPDRLHRHRQPPSPPQLRTPACTRGFPSAARFSSSSPARRRRAPEPTRFSTALAVRPAQWLGCVSYSWYLWHWPLILLAIAWLDRDSRRVTVTAALVSLVIATIVLVASLAVTQYGNHKIQTTEIALDDEAIPNDQTGEIYIHQRVGARTGFNELADVRNAQRNYDCPGPLEGATGIDYCEAGDAASATTVFLIGDSHTRHWVPAFIPAADQLDLRLIVRWRGSCPSTNVPVAASNMGGSVDPDCTDFQNDTDTLIEELDPQMVVLSNSSAYKPIDGTPAWRDGFRDRLSGLLDAGKAVGSLPIRHDFPKDPIECLQSGGTTNSWSRSRRRSSTS